MAMSKCLGCNGTMFEAVAKEPRGSSYKVIFVQCASCGGVAGVIDYMNTYVALQKESKEIKTQLGTIDRNVDIVNENLRRVAKTIR